MMRGVIAEERLKPVRHSSDKFIDILQRSKYAPYECQFDFNNKNLQETGPMQKDANEAY